MGLIVERHGGFGPDQQFGTLGLRHGQRLRAQREVTPDRQPLHGRFPFDVLFKIPLLQRHPQRLSGGPVIVRQQTESN